MELFQPQGARVSSHLSFNCFVTLKVAPRTAAPAASAGVGRGRTRGVMAGSVIRERVMVVERHPALADHGRVRAVTSPVPPFVSRRPGNAARTGTSTGETTSRQRTADELALLTRDARRSIGSIPANGVLAPDGRVDGRVFAAPRGLLQTEEAAQTFGHLVRRLRRQESRVTPVTAVARRAAEAPRAGGRDDFAARDQTFAAPRIGMGMPSAMQTQAAAEVNIESLASKVMQQIDRRLVAHRERMGRI